MRLRFWRKNEPRRPDAEATAKLTFHNFVIYLGVDECDPIEMANAYRAIPKRDEHELTRDRLIEIAKQVLAEERWAREALYDATFSQVIGGRA